MTATAKVNQSTKVQSSGNSSPDSQALSASKQTARQENSADRNHARAYIASLRRSITQMRNGDVQPVREGLEELRRELDADGEDNPVDK